MKGECINQGVMEAKAFWGEKPECAKSYRSESKTPVVGEEIILILWEFIAAPYYRIFWDNKNVHYMYYTIDY